jgi:RNA polymerase sigma-70 factor (ECF subfamily)
VAAPDEDDRLSQIETHWSLLIQAHQAPEPSARQARLELLPRYSRAVDRYLRRLVGDENDAQDLCQEFAVRFLRGDFRHADPERGRFRDYLKTSLHHLVSDFYRRRQAQAQGVPLDSQLLGGLVAPADRDAEFQAFWRAAVLDRTWAELAQHSAANNQLFYEVLRLRADDPTRTSEWIAGELARRHGRPFTAPGVRQLLHRARERFGELLRREVALSLGTEDPEAVTAELAELGLLVYCQPRPADDADG